MSKHKQILVCAAAGGAIQLEAAIGALQALDESGALADAEVSYRACSGGAPPSALHASGLSGAELARIIRSTPMSQLVHRPFGSRYYDISGVYEMLSEHMPPEPLRNCRVAITRQRDMYSCMADATPVSVAASMSIQGVIRGQIIDGETYGDGGVMNAIPTPKITDISRYDRIFFLLPPVSQEQPGKVGSLFPFFDTEIRAIAAFAARERAQFHEDGWEELSNVTLLEPPIPAAAAGRSLLAEMLDWSPGNCMIDAAYQHAKEHLNR